MKTPGYRRLLPWFVLNIWLSVMRRRTVLLSSFSPSSSTERTWPTSASPPWWRAGGRSWRGCWCRRRGRDWSDCSELLEPPGHSAAEGWTLGLQREQSHVTWAEVLALTYCTVQYCTVLYCTLPTCDVLAKHRLEGVGLLLFTPLPDGTRGLRRTDSLHLVLHLVLQLFLQLFLVRIKVCSKFWRKTGQDRLKTGGLRCRLAAGFSEKNYK